MQTKVTASFSHFHFTFSTTNQLIVRIRIRTCRRRIGFLTK